MNTSPLELSQRLVELACLAPSVHNTQPWKWHVTGNMIELFADRARQLHVTDPDGRNLVISCGAALHHAIVVAHAFGQSTDVTLVPALTQRDLLARIRLSPGVPPGDAVETLDLIGQRRTDRRRFTAWPVPDARLALLAQSASGWGAQVFPLVELPARHRTGLLLDRALRTQSADEQAVSERQAWTDHIHDNGVSATAAAPEPLPASSDRFISGATPDADELAVESTDSLLVICTETDDQPAWMQVGQALSALWLRATRDGLSIVPLSQLIEVTETRQALFHDVLGGVAWPQLLVRVGWQEISRAGLPRTPRRSLADVLVA